MEFNCICNATLISVVDIYLYMHTTVLTEISIHIRIVFIFCVTIKSSHPPPINEKIHHQSPSSTTASCCLKCQMISDVTFVLFFMSIASINRFCVPRYGLLRAIRYTSRGSKKIPWRCHHHGYFFWRENLEILWNICVMLSWYTDSLSIYSDTLFSWHDLQ
jgi:hypothetical protein